MRREVCPFDISNCFFTGKTEATEGVKGAMTAFFWSQGISISNCYAVGVGIYYSEDGSSSNYVLKNCYSNRKAERSYNAFRFGYEGYCFKAEVGI